MARGHPRKRGRGGRRTRRATGRKPERRKAVHREALRPGADERLKRVFNSIGAPGHAPFHADPFQLEAVEAIGTADCLVTAPTGSGKTWIAEQAIGRVLDGGGRAWYASPLKALSNSKLAEFAAIFGPEKVGILTGDRKENTDAPLVVGTTEILRNQLYDAMHDGLQVDTDLVVLDEAHFLGDRDRGVVWEEVMIYLSPTIPLLMLSATIGNADEIAEWLSAIRGKACTVVRETRRPVELVPLFLHPTGTLLPLVSPGKAKKGRRKLDHKVRSYLAQKRPPVLAPPRGLPPFGQILDVLEQFDLLPALFFLRSRRDCNRALDLCWEERRKPDEGRSRRVEELLEGHPHMQRHRQRRHLEQLAVGAHHGGQLPSWKLVLENLMSEGLLDAIFGTSTVAAGVNFPARSVVLFDSDRFNGTEFEPLTATEFQQMIGRAGRRGMDRVGFALAVPGAFMDLRLLPELLAAAPLPVTSQLRISFSMVLNVLLSHTPAQVRTLLERSFAAHFLRQAGSSPKRLWRAFMRHLRFLQERGYVSDEGALTERGRWAAKLRIDQPLTIAECLGEALLPEDDPELLAGLIAGFVYDREDDAAADALDIPGRLDGALTRVHRGLRSYALHAQRRGFEVRPVSVRAAITMYGWARGQSWSKVVSASGLADGDVVMLASRTADHLRHVAGLREAFPAVARTARHAVQALMRAPVT